MASTKRDRERKYFTRFSGTYGLPPGTICYADKPDVLIEGERTIGIEITNFYLQPGDAANSEQRQSPRRDEVVREAHRLYRDNGGKGIELTIQFNSARPISADRKRHLPGEIADLAGRVHDERSGPLNPLVFDAMPEIASIWLNNKEYPDAQWSVSQVHSVEAMVASKLEEIVREKESKCADYAPCDAYWLLVVVELMDPAQDQEIGTAIRIASNTFEKIFVYKPIFEEVLEVRCA
jgi:hypothetical protein